MSLPLGAVRLTERFLGKRQGDKANERWLQFVQK